MKKRLILSLIFGVVVAASGPGETSVFINEILADPPAGLRGDANGDGTRSGTEDEFVELFNPSAMGMDISGWSIADGIAVRHVFSAGAFLGPRAFLVVFGGGAPVFPAAGWQTASAGNLSLNNGGDTVSLRDVQGDVVDQVVYGAEGGRGQSLVRIAPAAGAGFILHSTAEWADGSLYSPGAGFLEGIGDDAAELDLSESLPPATHPTVPELPSQVSFFLGLGLLAFYKHKGLLWASFLGRA